MWRGFRGAGLARVCTIRALMLPNPCRGNARVTNRLAARRRTRVAGAARALLCRNLRLFWPHMQGYRFTDHRGLCIVGPPTQFPKPFILTCGGFTPLLHQVVGRQNNLMIEVLPLGQGGADPVPEPVAQVVTLPAPDVTLSVLVRVPKNQTDRFLDSCLSLVRGMLHPNQTQLIVQASQVEDVPRLETTCSSWHKFCGLQCKVLGEDDDLFMAADGRLVLWWSVDAEMLTDAWVGKIVAAVDGKRWTSLSFSQPLSLAHVKVVPRAPAGRETRRTTVTCRDIKIVTLGSRPAPAAAVTAPETKAQVYEVKWNPFSRPCEIPWGADNIPWSAESQAQSAQRVPVSPGPDSEETESDDEPTVLLKLGLKPVGPKRRPAKQPGRTSTTTRSKTARQIQAARRGIAKRRRKS